MRTSHITVLTVQINYAVRLDKYLRIEYGSIQQSNIEKAIRKGDILVNSHKTHSAYRVQNGDEITIYRLNSLVSIIAPSTVQNVRFCDNVVGLANKMLDQWRVYEDDNLIAINKPTKIPTQGGSKVLISIDHAIAYINYINNYSHFDLWRLVHRLDKDTSGVLMIAKNLTAAQKIAHGFKMHDITKTYYAVVSGHPPKDRGVIDSYIASKDSKGQMQVQANNSVTHYQLITKLRGIENGVDWQGSLIAFRPKTGRNHQIRIHAASIDCPIVGDRKYGGREEKYMLLHAKELTIPSSLLGNEIELSAPLPFYFNKFLN
ncbi:RluA family pseudouridine synthase [Rickettsiales endosymbiont of Paramecium tredecaurelia]|uniref:RluA family pseudouridine synthase n=1 Tax=Candidatus Sarmatiella mevalonica TaxID=2770581 RepID=UPI001924F62A|nr:RluA family pseudouridine synthase [Candidatus Sarmatiella mevalonica]MBL3284216.1 RluA family pseudouridine synthase [Candidatus Sarmatiella mevalonica]